MSKDDALLYDAEFYNRQMGNSERAAIRIAPLVQDIVKAKSVIDIGCGVGAWLKAFREIGCENILGVDGDYVDRNLLKIPSDQFKVADLSQPFHYGPFDLAISLEVAEHIPASAADIFVESLTKCADAILFSAAIPFQGGVNHINEQWPSYWIAKFRKHNFEILDCIRPQIWNDRSLPSAYRQNCLLFCKIERVKDLNLPAAIEPITDMSLPDTWEWSRRQVLAVPHYAGIRAGLRATSAGLYAVAYGVAQKVRSLGKAQS